MGAAPKPNAQRRRGLANGVITRLPAEGRKGGPPPWPLSGAGCDLEIWAELWSTPQAAAWETLGPGMVRVVARYVVLLAEAEVGEPKVAAEVRQVEDRLGLSPLAMLRLRWEIAPDEVAEQRDQRTATKAQADVRSRLRIVDPASGQ
jgi:hypothetical protein